MKGIVFTEFLDMVEAAYGLDTLDRIVERAELPNGGAYTAVGTYDHHELVRLVGCLSQETERPVPDLIRAYGEHLFTRFADKYSMFFATARSSFEFLQSIDDTIHVEVLKLYPDAELPRFDCEARGDDRMEIVYRSSRPFADLAEGLILGCIRHFGEDIAIERENLSTEHGSHVRFSLRRRT